MVFHTQAQALCCSPPDYVARVESPIRQHYPVPRAKEQEIIESIREDSEYNAYDKDIAVVNIFFGKPTTIGEGFLSYLFSNLQWQSMRGSRG